MNVLIVDDSKSSAKLICAMVTELRYTATYVTSSEAAWERLQSEPFDVLLTDWVMPGMDGLALCQRVRSSTRDRYTYVILMTGRDHIDGRTTGVAAGADDYLLKPVDPAELAARLMVAARITQLQVDLNDRSEETDRALCIAEEANYRFAELFRSLPIACVTLDADGTIQDWNHASEELFGVRADQAMQKSIFRLLYKNEQPEKVKQRLSRIFNGGRTQSEEWVFEHADGSTRTLVRSAFPMYGKDKSIVGCMCAHVDITERKSLESRLSDQLRISQQLNITLDAQRRALEESNRQLSELALRDSLTGLFNRRHLMTTLDKSFSYAIRHNKPLSILMIDVDQFKNYNDDFGHLAGDEVLKVVARLITKCLRNEDSVGRYGGEEYLAIMPDASAEGSRLVANRLQATLHQHAWVEREVTVSIGIASLNENTPTTAILLDVADQALYTAKRAGRNTIVVAHQLNPEVWRAA